jgi:hypothetical protein
VRILFARILESTKNGQILFDRILASTKNGQILFARILASTKLVKSYLLEFQQGRKVKILFARILARKIIENPVC